MLGLAVPAQAGQRMVLLEATERRALQSTRRGIWIDLTRGFWLSMTIWIPVP